MIDVALLCGEEEICKDFSEQSIRQQVNFESTNSISKLLRLIEVNQPDAVLIIEHDQEQLQAAVSDIAQQSNIPILVATTRTEHLMEVWADKVFDLITLPVMKEEFWFWFGRVAILLGGGNVLSSRAAMQGKLHDISAIDLIQILEGRGKSAIIQLTRGDQSGKIWLQDGNIQSANYRGFGQVEAVLHLLTWPDGAFSVTFESVEIIKSIELKNEQILLEAAQRIDKRDKLLSFLPGTDETLLISPELDLFQNKDHVSAYLKFFQGGKTINELLQHFDVDELILLDQVYDFVQSKKLMTRDQFDRYHTAYEQESADQGVKNRFKKWFGKKPKPRARIKVERETKQNEAVKDKPVETEQASPQILESMLLADQNDLKDFQIKIQEL